MLKVMDKAHVLW